MWFRGRIPRNEAVVAAPSSIVGKSNDASSKNNSKHESVPSSRKKRPKQQESNLKTATTQTRQVKVTPVEHAAILRERLRLHEARQKRNDESKRKLATIMTEDAATGRLRHKEKQTSFSHKSRNIISRLNGSVSYRRNGVASRRTRASRIVRALFFILVFVFGLAILFVYSPFLHVDTSFQSKQSQQNSTKVYFLDAAKHVDDNKDLFSASWLQPVESFLKFDTSGKNLATKQAGINALFRSNLKKVQMTLDWLDFSVEHLSSWIHATDILKYHHNDNVAFHVILSKLYEYIKSVVIHDSNKSMKDTIAVIAFEPWSSRTKPHVATQLSVASLAATIASMIQAGFGRVVVVGYHVQDEEYADESFRLVLSLISNHNASNTTKSSLDKIQGTELAYVRAATEDVISLQTPINIVKGALAGLQNALMSSTKKRQHEWLGTGARNASSWKYVYLTEADSILHTKPSSLPFLKKALDRGMILAPHRLQALPHEYDLAGMKNRNKMVPAIPSTVGNFSTILQLHPWEGAVCCDEHSQNYYKPWKQYPKCNSHWWQCGFNDQQDHSRLEHYSLIRLSNPGMNIVSLAANHNGRRCKPSTSRGVCIPPNKAK